MWETGCYCKTLSQLRKASIITRGWQQNKSETTETLDAPLISLFLALDKLTGVYRHGWSTVRRARFDWHTVQSFLLFFFLSCCIFFLWPHIVPVSDLTETESFQSKCVFLRAGYHPILEHLGNTWLNCSERSHVSCATDSTWELNEQLWEKAGEACWPGTLRLDQVCVRKETVIKLLSKKS